MTPALSNRERQRLAACEAKSKFVTAKAARKASHRASQKGSLKVAPYLCRHCKWFHIGSTLR